MLQSLREKTSGPVAIFIVGLIAVPFAFFGIEQFSTGGGDPTLAKVGDQKITQSQFQRSYQQRYQQLAGLMGENFRADLIDQDRFQATVLQDMVEESVLRQYVEEQGFRVSDAALFEFISEIPQFQSNGRFDTEAYRAALARQGSSPAQFEQRVRNSLEIEQLREGMLGTALVTSADLRLNYRLQHQQRYVSHVRFRASDYVDSVEVSDEEVAAHYADHSARYQAPERIKLNYLEINLDNLPATEAPSDEVLRAIYEAEKLNRFTAPEERLARHILIKFGADKDAARAEAEALLEQIKGGADFAELAEEKSQDTGSKSDGGSLGWVRRGQMVEAFEAALFKLKAGGVSDVVESEFGWHIIRLEELRASAVQAFDEPAVRDQLLELYNRRENERRFSEMNEQLELIAFESPDSLQTAAEALGLKVQTTAWFTRAGGTGITADTQIREAAFSDDVLAGENSPPLQLSATRTVVIRKNEYEPARQRELSEVAAQIRSDLVQQAAREAAAAAAEQALAKLREGQSLEATAEALGRELVTTGLVKRDNKELDRLLVRKLFSMPPPAAEQAQFAATQLVDGSTAVVALSAIQDANLDDAEAAERSAAEQQLRNSLAGSEFGAYRGAIRDAVSVQLVQQPQSDQGS